MVSGPTQTQLRQRRAQEALDALGSGRAAAELMSVQCPRSHHLAAVYATESGPVVLTHPAGHAHGSKDFVDTGHRAPRRADRPDLLDAGSGADDVIPGWCDCGPHSLSRTDLLARLAAGQQTARVGAG
jgi:hypothetical protein